MAITDVGIKWYEDDSVKVQTNYVYICFGNMRTRAESWLTWDSLRSTHQHQLSLPDHGLLDLEEIQFATSFSIGK